MTASPRVPGNRLIIGGTRSGRKSAGGGADRPEQDRDPRISDAGHSGRRRADEDGGRRHLRHRRQALQAPADQQAHHHGPREHRLSSPRPAASSPSARASRKATSSSSSTTSCAASASGATPASTATARTPTGAPIPTRIRYGYTSAEKAPHLWGGFAQYVYLPWNAVVHHVPKGVTPELAGLVTPMANGVEWSLFDGGVGYNSTVLIQGPGQQGLSQTVICKQAGASLIIVTGTSKDARADGGRQGARRRSRDRRAARKTRSPASWRSPAARASTSSLDCTAGAGTIPILLGIEALKRKAGTIVAQGEMKEFPNFPLEKFTVKFITMKSARGHSYQGLRAGAGAARLEALPAGEGHHPPVRPEGRRPRHPLGRRRGRAGRDPRLADAVGVR